MIEFLALNGAWLEMGNDTMLGEWFEQVVAHEMSESGLIAALAPYLQALGD